MDVKMLCETAHVSRSGYYAWLKTADDPDRDFEDANLITEIFEKGKRKYGSRTIKMKLPKPMNLKKVQRVMKKYRLFARIRRINPYRMIMKKSLEHRTFENVLDRQFVQDKPRTVLSTDITYVPYNNRIAYLSVIKDVASREIVAWCLSHHLDMSIVLDTLKDLEKTLGTTLTDTLIHSDQGVHYTHPQYIAWVKKMGMTQSMSRQGNCIDNAPIESFFGHFKDDVDYKSCKSFDQLLELIRDYMPYYNNGRQQWGLKKMTPVAYRDHLLVTAA